MCLRVKFVLNFYNTTVFFFFLSSTREKIEVAKSGHNRWFEWDQDPRTQFVANGY